MRQCATYKLHLGDATKLLGDFKPSSVHAVVTDPPFGLVEYTAEHLEKMRKGNGGIWRLPMNYDGVVRQPAPRFTVLTKEQHSRIGTFFAELAKQLERILVPGAHVMLAANTLVSHLVDLAFVENGFEKRGQIVRVVRTLRGGDRPKNAEKEFPGISVSPRGSWEPWLLFRKPCEGRVQDNLRKWKTGGLRRPSPDLPFTDLIQSTPATREERDLAPHPSLKPQAFLRQLVHAALPLGEGLLVDPFMGSGSTIAAASHMGAQSVGIEIHEEYFHMAESAIPNLAQLEVRSAGGAPKDGVTVDPVPT